MSDPTDLVLIMDNQDTLQQLVEALQFKCKAQEKLIESLRDEIRKKDEELGSLRMQL